MEERYKQFDATLEALHSSGALSELILIGSWCQHVYKYSVDNADEISAHITSDIDFLIPDPVRPLKDIDIPSILSRLGFEMIASHVSMYTKYISRELEVEFLVAERGRGYDGPLFVKKLHVNAQGLRYLNMLQEHSEMLVYRGIPLRVAVLEAYVLHKFLISGRRIKVEKREKDLSLSEFILLNVERIEKARRILSSIHPRWKKEIMNQIEKHSPDLFSAVGLRGKSPATQ